MSSIEDVIDWNNFIEKNKSTDDEIYLSQIMKEYDYFFKDTKPYKGTPQHKMGKWGQSYVTDFFTGQGMKVMIPMGRGSRYDFIMNDKKFEVKTQTLFKSKNSFTINTNELQKYADIAFIIFVSASLTHYPGEVFIISKEDFMKHHVEYTTKDDRKMWLCDVTNMQSLFTLSDEQLQKIIDIKSSDDEAKVAVNVALVNKSSWYYS